MSTRRRRTGPRPTVRWLAFRWSRGPGGASSTRSRYWPKPTAFPRSRAVKKIRFDEVKNLYEYEKVRDAIRREVIALKARRRVAVGDRLSLLFENRKTVLFQIQEMIRAERIVADDRVQDEIDVYNELIPGPGELS